MAVSDWESPDHALKAGMLLGMLLKHGIVAYPETDGEDYLPIVNVETEIMRDGNPIVVQVRVLDA